MIPDHIKPILEADAQAYVKRLVGWPYAGVAVHAETWARRKYLFAREVWPKREEGCPGFKDSHGGPITWTQRFAEMWHEPLSDYRARLHAAQTQVAA